MLIHVSSLRVSLPLQQGITIFVEVDSPIVIKPQNIRELDEYYYS